jgi:uncharacterized membrane protein YfcA
MIEYWQWPLLLATGLAAGFVDSIAGGGGLITLPVLLTCGLAPQVALGTNKLQASFGSGSATWHYAAAGTVALGDCARGALCSLIGSALGSLAVQQLDPAFLRRAIPVLLAAAAFCLLFKPQLGAADLHPRMQRAVFDVAFGLTIGFYDGFFGPGTGTFWAMAYVLALGFNLARATGHTKVMNFASNLGSLMFFLAGGRVLFGVGLIMGIGQLIGARLGSRMVIAKGARFVRPVFLLVVLALTIKLLLDAYIKPAR